MSDDELRASDAERERTASLLREHHAVGRLTAEEFEYRLEAVFAARRRGDLDALLRDLPAIDLYQLPSAAIRPAYRAAARPRRGPGLDRRADAPLLPAAAGGWVTWTAASSLLLVLWLGIGIASGGAAWLPWFLLVVVPWALALARRNHP